jgi:uncharacterized protein (UPF0332 family)
MDAADFLTLANQLATQPDEASQRSAVSRAYYAAYHHCKDWHGNLKAPGSAGGLGGGVHQVLINQLNQPAPELTAAEKLRSKSLSYKLKAMRTLRNKADYKLQDALDAAEVEDALSTSKSLLN